MAVGDVAPRWTDAIVDGKFVKGGPNGTVVMGDAVVGTDTPAEVLAKIVTVDGAGSNLDADLLDGQHGVYYLASSVYTAADVLTKIKTVDGAASGLDADLLDGLQATAFILTSVIDTDPALTADSDAKLATQRAVKAYVNGIIAAQDAMVFKGVIDCSANPNYPAADRGWTYRVSVAGKIGGASGPNVEAGDVLLCTTDGTASGNQATVGANWGIIQMNIDGALTTASIGVTVQAYDAQLAALAATTPANGYFTRWTSATTAQAQALLGTVSMSGGVPTGAIAEIGSNANGSYVKYLDGTMIAWFEDTTGQDINVALGTANFRSTGTFAWTFPVAFKTGTKPSVTVNLDASTRWWNAQVLNNTSCNIRQFGAVQSTTLVAEIMCAVGYW